MSIVSIFYYVYFINIVAGLIIGAIILLDSENEGFAPIVLSVASMALSWLIVYQDRTLWMILATILFTLCWGYFLLLDQRGGFYGKEITITMWILLALSVLCVANLYGRNRYLATEKRIVVEEQLKKAAEAEKIAVKVAEEEERKEKPPITVGLLEERVKEISGIRNRLNVKELEFSSLKEGFKKEVEKHKDEIKEECRKRAQCPSSFDQALADIVISSSLALIQKKRTYITALGKLEFQIKKSSQELRFLAESAEADARLMKVAGNEGSRELVEAIDKIIKESIAYDNFSKEMMEKISGAKSQNLEPIWKEILAEEEFRIQEGERKRQESEDALLNTE
ncbi:hypothetical protein HYV44_03105 [Candidatus Microgenomates bacterium]|nr:hypothetical protein [Candidatus Microgenomates bacterium]